MAKRWSHRRAIGGTSGGGAIDSISSGAGTSGIVRSQNAGPGRGLENAPSASPIEPAVLLDAGRARRQRPPRPFDAGGDLQRPVGGRLGVVHGQRSWGPIVVVDGLGQGAQDDGGEVPAVGAAVHPPRRDPAGSRNRPSPSGGDGGLAVEVELAAHGRPDSTLRRPMADARCAGHRRRADPRGRARARAKVAARAAWCCATRIPSSAARCARSSSARCSTRSRPSG